MTARPRNWLIAILILAFPFVMLLGFLIPHRAPLPPLLPLPNPNGYDEVVKAGKMIQGDVWDYDQASLEKLRVIVSTNAEALALARSALSNQCGVTLQLSKAYLTKHIPDLTALRNLAQALLSEGKLAEKEHRFGDAANSYLDAVRLGNQSASGGIMADVMMGTAIGSFGVKQLQGIATNLDAPACRRTAATLETLAAGRQTWAVIMQQDSAWLRRVCGWREQWQKWIHYSARKTNLQRAADKFRSDEKLERQLLVNLAARACEMGKGKPPASVADLVPDYLKAIPQDPVTGTNMVYSPR